MHEFWETTPDVEVLRDELRRQGQFVRVFDERNTEHILEAIKARAEIERLRASRDAVLELHRPLNDLGAPPCLTCRGEDEDGESTFVLWPCPTAIAANADGA